jgi:hypothetical protein
MGFHISVDHKEQKVEVWMCLELGCVRYEELSDWVFVSLDDRRKDGLRVTKSLAVKKRERYSAFVEDFMNNELPTITETPKADEDELLEAYRFVSKRVKSGIRYVGTKIELTTPRGVRVYYRVRHEERSDGIHVVVEIEAEKDGEKITYTVFGTTNNANAAIEEAAKAIGAYILFTEYIRT